VIPFVAAGLQVAPTPGPLTPASIKANVDAAIDLARQCVDATGARVVVAPETVTTGFAPGLGPAELWDLLGPIPGPLTEGAQALAADLGVVLVWPTYEAGPSRGVVFNAAAVIGPGGDVLGTYRKTHLFPAEREWATPGDDVLVVPTPFGRLGSVICFDGDFPELVRIEAGLGAEVVVRPSAFLRAADIWELTTRARAYDNHVYVVAPNAVGTDPGGFVYFGNSLIVGPTGEVLARGTSQPGWVSATVGVEPMATMSPGSSVRQGFDHLADRNVALYRRHRAVLESEATAAFPLRPAAPPPPAPPPSSGAGRRESGQDPR
jgi:deaminated glutathione amidase